MALLLVLLALATYAMTCSSGDPGLLKACEEVAPRVEGLWGQVNAEVELRLGEANYASGVPGSHKYLVTLTGLNYCTLAHELTHVIEMEKGAYWPRWFAEGLAELSCYLLYPELYKRTGYVDWLSKGFGDLSPYFFGLTVLYYLYSKGEDVWRAREMSLYEAAKAFAEAISAGATPYGAAPLPPPFGEVELEGGWAYGGTPSGQYWKFGKVEVFYGPGRVSYFPFLALVLPPDWLRKCGRVVGRRARRRG